MPAGNALGAGQVSGGELFAATDVDDRDALVGELVDLGGVDLLDTALDLAEQLWTGRAHLETPKRRSGFIDFRKYSALCGPGEALAKALPGSSGDEQVGEA